MVPAALVELFRGAENYDATAGAGCGDIAKHRVVADQGEGVQVSKYA